MVPLLSIMYRADPKESGITSLVSLIHQLPETPATPVSQILHECAIRLAGDGAERQEYLLLAIYMLTLYGR